MIQRAEYSGVSNCEFKGSQNVSSHMVGIGSFVPAGESTTIELNSVDCNYK